MALAIEFYKTEPILFSENAIQDIDLSARLIENDSFISDFVIKNSFGYSNKVLSTEKAYHVEIESEFGDFSTSKVNLIDPLKINNIEINLNKDSSHVELFINVDYPKDTLFYYYSIDLMVDDLILETIERNIKNYGELYFPNANKILFSKGILFPSFDENGVYLGPIRANKIKITLFNISNEVVNFFKSVSNSNGELGNQNTEKEPLWSNINGCYGFLGSYSVDSTFFEF